MKNYLVTYNSDLKHRPTHNTLTFKPQTIITDQSTKRNKSKEPKIKVIQTFGESEARFFLSSFDLCLEVGTYCFLSCLDICWAVLITSRLFLRLHIKFWAFYDGLSVGGLKLSVFFYKSRCLLYVMQ